MPATDATPTALSLTTIDPLVIGSLAPGADYDAADFGLAGILPATKQLYLTDGNTQGLDRNDPVAGGDATTSTSVELGGVGDQAAVSSESRSFMR